MSVKPRTLEDYLRTIYELRQSGRVRGVDIARLLHVSKPAVSRQLIDLEAEGYVTRPEDRTVRLTRKGSRLGRLMYERNANLVDLLIGMGVDEEAARRDACEMEHAMSEQTYEAIIAYFFDPVVRQS